MKRFLRVLLALIVLVTVGAITYQTSPRVKYYTYFGIWLAPSGEQFEFTSHPNLFSLFGMDGHSTAANFEVENDKLAHIIASMSPSAIWIKYSLQDSTVKDETLNFPCDLPKKVLKGEVKFMLYSSDVKGDDYNIWFSPKGNGRTNVSAHMSFT